MASTTLGKTKMIYVRIKGDVIHWLMFSETGICTLTIRDGDSDQCRPGSPSTSTFGLRLDLLFLFTCCTKQSKFNSNNSWSYTAPGAKTTQGKLIPDAAFLCSSLYAFLPPFRIQILPSDMIFSSFSKWGLLLQSSACCIIIITAPLGLQSL